MTVTSIWILFILSYVAIRFNIYYTLPWFDTMMHFFGGAVSALVVYSILNKLRIGLSRPTAAFIGVVFGVILVGLGWEVIEYVVNYYIPTYAFDLIDTTVDLIADTVGAIVATTFIFQHKNKHNHGN